MGGFVILLLALMAVLGVMFSTQETGPVGGMSDNKPGLQAVAGNLFEFHRQAVDFVSQSQNRNPTNGTLPNRFWAFTASNQAAVLCSGAYPTGSVGGTCTAPTTEFRPPAFFNNLYNWNVCHVSDGAGGNTDIVVTYATAGDAPGGYAGSAIAEALRGFKPDTYYGVTTAGSVISNEAGATLTLGACASPCGVACASVVAIATIIP